MTTYVLMASKYSIPSMRAEIATAFSYCRKHKRRVPIRGLRFVVDRITTVVSKRTKLLESREQLTISILHDVTPVIAKTNKFI